MTTSHSHQLALGRAIVALTACASMLTSCASHYRVVGVERERLVIDQRYDAAADNAATLFLAPYKARVDSVMSPVVGTTARQLDRQRPESPLSNLLADILLWGSEPFGEQPQFAVYNMGGIRAAFAKGDVTYGDVLDVAPFENKICFLTLSGSDVMALFRQIASVGGEAVSHGVRLEITADGRLLSATINGEPVGEDRSYRIATLDYLAEGNDKLVAFKQKTDVNQPLGEQNNVRNIIVAYFRHMASQGVAVDSQTEGRIIVKK